MPTINSSDAASSVRTGVIVKALLNSMHSIEV